jgi:hypothetical protein
MVFNSVLNIVQKQKDPICLYTYQALTNLFNDSKNFNRLSINDFFQPSNNKIKKKEKTNQDELVIDLPLQSNFVERNVFAFVETTEEPHFNFKVVFLKE